MKYIGNLKDVITKDFIQECKLHAEKYKDNQRTKQQKIKQTIQGEGVEKLVCQYFHYKEVHFSIPEYDAVDEYNKKYEIKHTIYNIRFWSFKPQQYKFFIQNANKLDYIILCYLDEETLDVYIKFKANAKSFYYYSDKSQYNNKYFYKHNIAQQNNECIIY